jgi:hypothetical protein
LIDTTGVGSSLECTCVLSTIPLPGLKPSTATDVIGRCGTARTGRSSAARSLPPRAYRRDSWLILASDNRRWKVGPKLPPDLK